jgi:pSer/pThr/pTyr-binding forkhead associated (FHA) protein
MEVRLKVVGGKNAGHELILAGPKFFIGRAEDCQLRPKSDLVSRHHCVILVEEGFVAIRDFGSKNGTLINGQAVAG